jgi:hypothetical protein
VRVLGWGLGLFAAAFLVQLAAWRVRVPVRQVKVLLVIFAGALVAAAAAGGLAAAAASPWQRFFPRGGAQWLQLAIFHAAATLAYMITYSAVEVDSPSLHMVLAIRAGGAAGLPEAELLALRRDDRLVAPRVRDLVTDRMAVLEGERYRLTPKGALLARTFALYRRVLGAGLGG